MSALKSFRTLYGDRERVSLSFVDEHGEPLIGLTKQSFKDECDINNVLSKYEKTGLVSHVSKSVAHYGDFTEVNEYQESLNRVIEANEAFMALPSDVRKRFQNDAGAFFEFATNPDNADAMAELGLTKPVVEEKPILVEMVSANDEVIPAD